MNQNVQSKKKRNGRKLRSLTEAGIPLTALVSGKRVSFSHDKYRNAWELLNTVIQLGATIVDPEIVMMAEIVLRDSGCLGDSCRWSLHVNDKLWPLFFRLFTAQKNSDLSAFVKDKRNVKDVEWELV